MWSHCLHWEPKSLFISYFWSSNFFPVWKVTFRCQKSSFGGPKLSAVNPPAAPAEPVPRPPETARGAEMACKAQRKTDEHCRKMLEDPSNLVHFFSKVGLNVIQNWRNWHEFMRTFLGTWGAPENLKTVNVAQIHASFSIHRSLSAMGRPPISATSLCRYKDVLSSILSVGWKWRSCCYCCCCWWWWFWFGTFNMMQTYDHSDFFLVYSIHPS